MARRIRFGWMVPGPTSRERLVEVAAAAERIGYSTVAMNDHFSSTLAPLLGLLAIADETSSVRVATAVLNQDMRHPAVLAKEVATLDLLSGGRLELGLGAGWVVADYEQSGIRLDRASERIERLEENVVILRGLFRDGPFRHEGKHFTIRDLVGVPSPAQPGGPPILIGGGGRRLLSVAARQADIVQVLGATVGRTQATVVDLSSFRTEAYEKRLGWIREAAGARFADLELSLHLAYVAITADAERAAASFLENMRQVVGRYGGEVRDFDLRLDALLEGPTVAIGSLDEVCDKLRRVRDALGFSYFIAPYGSTPEALAPVVQRLAGA